MTSRASDQSPPSGGPKRGAGPRTPAVVFDTETTGFPNNGAGFRARIVEVGAVVMTADGRVVSPISFLVRQPEPHLRSWQAQRAMRTHGIAVEQILREGLDPRQAAPRLALWIQRVQERFGVREARAYNQGFDFWFLEQDPWRIFERTGLTKGEDIQVTARRGMSVARGPRLSAAVAFAQAAGGELGWSARAHRAAQDARMAACVALHFG